MITYVNKIRQKDMKYFFFLSYWVRVPLLIELKKKKKTHSRKWSNFFLERRTCFSFRQIYCLSCTLLHSWAFRQWYPTTNVQDKSSSVMVGRHFWFPPALRCDLLDAPLSLWWWRNRSCIFSSLKKRCFLKQKPMLSLPLKNWLLFLAILIKALYSFLFVFF